MELTTRAREEARQQHLNAFLAGFDLTIDALCAEIDDAFGDVLLAVATGSVLQGFGNTRSDVDVYVVVERDVSALPVLSFAGDARIDVVYHQQEALLHQHDAALAPWPVAGSLSQAGWVARKRAVDATTRFALSTALAGESSWVSWRRSIDGERLQEAVVEWWTVEALRRWHGATVLTTENPTLARQRYCDAALAMLERRAAQSGQVYFTSKWLPEKFRATDDDEGLDLCRLALRLSAPNYEQVIDELLTDMLDWDGARRSALSISLTYQEGVEAMPLGRRALVSRWKARFTQVGLPAVEVSEGVEAWRGGWLDPLPVDIRTLFAHDMLWSAVVAS